MIATTSNIHFRMSLTGSIEVALARLSCTRGSPVCAPPRCSA